MYKLRGVQKMIENKTYIFHEDNAHGWLQVERKEINELGLAEAVSIYSYQRGKYVFLEEDCDMTRFCLAYCNKFGYSPMIISSNSREAYSQIRDFDRYFPKIEKPLTNIKIVVK
jgi:hypothetical protein